jgi:TPP-dependent indolepyruvate ferredoxin oxidoreductase alpha subunit
MTWPLGLDDLMAFAAGAGEILVVEEKQPIVEDQLKAGLFNYPAARRPRVTGKTDGAGAPLLPATLELNPLLVAQALVARLTALNSPAVAETVFSVTVLPAALKSLLTVLAAALLLVATAESDPRSVRAVCSERFSRASQAVMLLLVIRVAAPAEAFLLPLHRSHRLQ